MNSSLEGEIAQGRLEISADAISMSISELTNLYREGVLQIRPEFQRLYRWSAEQKSRLVESVLIGIPLPSLFVAQSESGSWELVDGLQRVSTLLELQGLLRDENGGLRPPFELTGTKYLPSLDGHSWNGVPGTASLSDAQKLDIRLARLDLRVIKRGSDPQAKFDLFQRLNSFGSSLTAQEIRSATIAAVNGDCLAWLNSLAQSPAFEACTALPERLVDEQYDVELVLRFLMLHDRAISGSERRLSDFSSRLDDWAISFAGDFADRRESVESIFFKTFDVLAAAGEDVFRKWDARSGRFRGSFLNTSYEVIALGIGFHIAHGNPFRADIVEAAKSLWQLSIMTARFATGLATQDRLVKTIPLGRNLMAIRNEGSVSPDV